ncbi:MAG: peptide deformylase [Spirochaetales bacterium]|nr:peptide deformylase [Spirochaetales bacterium]
MDVITLGNELLRQKSAPVEGVDEKLRQFFRDMFEIMSRQKGVGLAAVQVSSLLRFFITNVPKDKPRIFINPEIIETSIEQDVYEEGCLSVPGVNADIERPSSVKIQAYNEKERPFTLSCENNLLARVIQHELDHLNGVLFIDHLPEGLKRELVTEYINNKKKKAAS